MTSRPPGFTRARIAVCLIALLVLPWDALAQTETPEEVTRQYLEAMREEDWAGMADLMHPAALVELRDFLQPLFESEVPEAADFRQQFLGVRTMDEALALSDATVFTNFLRAMSRQTAEFGTALRGTTILTIGHVPEGADTIHVVYRATTRLEGMTITRMAVFSMRRYEQTWRGLLTGDYSALASALRRALGD